MKVYIDYISQTKRKFRSKSHESILFNCPPDEFLRVQKQEFHCSFSRRFAHIHTLSTKQRPFGIRYALFTIVFWMRGHSLVGSVYDFEISPGKKGYESRNRAAPFPGSRNWIFLFYVYSRRKILNSLWFCCICLLRSLWVSF